MGVHFVGVGGYGMGPLAELLHLRGEKVSGCDARENERTQRLRSLGVTVWVGHSAEHLEGVEEVVYSTDVPADHPELQAARERGMQVRHRSQILARVLEGAQAVAVTGTHGKTTTTTLVVHLLAAAGMDPTGLVGAEVPAWGGGLRRGRPDLVVAEADESDGSFLRYTPHVAVVTNVEPEHLEHYGGEFARVRAAYRAFLARVPAGGTVVLWGDDPHLAAMAQELPATVRVRLYGEGLGAQVRAREAVPDADGWTFTVERDGRPYGRVHLGLRGRHNVLNALAALEVALTLGAPWPLLAQALPTFQNARRRFQVVGTAGGVTVIDDYAHHPTEIQAVLAAARELAPRRLWVIFQPQRYVRTRTLWREFTQAFSQADAAILTDIYSPPGETPLPGVSGEALARDVAAIHPQAAYAPTPEEAAHRVAMEVAPGDVVVVAGAGDVGRAARELLTLLAGAREPQRTGGDNLSV